MKRRWNWNSVCKDAPCLDIEEDVLFACFFSFVVVFYWLQLLCCWELDSVPVLQCVLVFAKEKKSFQLFEIFYFFIVYKNPFRWKEGSLWNVFLSQMVTFLGSKWNHLVETLVEKYHLWSLENARTRDTNVGWDIPPDSGLSAGEAGQGIFLVPFGVLYSTGLSFVHSSTLAPT